MSPNPLQLPRRGNALSSFLGRMLMAAFGWKVAGPPPEVPKAVIIGGPHTSNWDGVFTLAAMVSLNLDARVMIKGSAFVGPMGWLLRAMGGIPIDRHSPKDLVQQSIDQFLQNDQMVLIVSPEGTRGGASQWKTGFWRIAKGAGVPVIIATADYHKKEIAFPSMITLSDDLSVDMAKILACYRGVEPRHPQYLSAPLAALRRQVEEEKKAEGKDV